MVTSNLQMSLILMTIMLFGLIDGYIQSSLEDRMFGDLIFGIFNFELMRSCQFGISLGCISSVVFEFVRQAEVKDKKEPKKEEKTLNFDDDQEEERVSLVQIPKHPQHR
jgi:hypothetical protein